MDDKRRMACNDLTSICRLDGKQRLEDVRDCRRGRSLEMRFIEAFRMRLISSRGLGRTLLCP